MEKSINSTYLYDLIKARQSDRKYDPQRGIDPQVIRRILEAARLAPSATNAQPWHFIVVDDLEKRDQVAQAMTSPLTGKMNAFAREAPVHIILVEESPSVLSRMAGLIQSRHYPHIDLGIAAEHICLAARAEGVGSCMVGFFDEKKIKKILQIPRSRKVLLVITLGYSLEKEKEKNRKSYDEIVSYNKYNG